MTGPRAKPPVCWALADGRAGHMAQAAGVLAAAKLSMIRKTLPPWRGWLPQATLARLCPPALRADAMSAPPQVVVSCGRRAAAAAVALRRAMVRRGMAAPFLLHIHDPGLPPSHFNMVTAPAHERLSRRAGDGFKERLAVTRGALGRASPEGIARAAAIASAAWRSMPRPWIVALAGGGSHAFTLNRDTAADLGAKLRQLARDTGGSVFLSTSARTGMAAAEAIRAALGDVPNLVWDGAPKRGLPHNPYMIWLGMADAVLVTADSISMTSEACVTGRPVYVLPLPRRRGPRAWARARKVARFHRHMRDGGHARPFAGRIDANWTPPVLHETGRVAGLLRAALGLD